MIDLKAIFSVFRFESRQAATVPRMAWWLSLTLFPVLLTLLLQWADDKFADEDTTQNEVRVERVVAEKISKGGMPTVVVDGNRLSGIRALNYLNRELGVSETERNLKNTADILLKQAQMNLPRGKDAPAGNPFDGWEPEPPEPQPILVLQYPKDLEADDPRIEKAETLLKDGFDRVVFFPEGEEPPNVLPPTTGSLFWGAGLYILLPSVVAMLSTFLWAAPAISSELEGRSWAYIATRPNGPINVLLGKYLIGVVWGMSSAVTALALSLMIAKTGASYFYLFTPLLLLILLACPAYGAIFTLIGTIAPRRSMVVAVTYILTFEGLISFLPVLGIPSLISRITVQYPLRSMMVRALRLDELPEDFTSLTSLVVGESNNWIDVASIALITVIALATSVWVLRSQELSQADESDS